MALYEQPPAGAGVVREGDLILVGHEGAMPGFRATMLASRKHRLVAAVLTNAGNRGDPAKVARQMITKALEIEPPAGDPWAPGEPPPTELRPVLGHWWTEGYEFSLLFREGRLTARWVDDPPDKEPARFEREGPDRYRTISGPEQGELLEIVRDHRGEPIKLYWATYPCARAFQTFSSAPDS